MNVDTADLLVAVSNVVYLAAALAKDIRWLRVLSIGGAAFSISFFALEGRTSGVLCGLVWCGIHAGWLVVLLTRPTERREPP